MLPARGTVETKRRKWSLLSGWSLRFLPAFKVFLDTIFLDMVYHMVYHILDTISISAAVGPEPFDPQHSRGGWGTLLLSVRWLLADLLWTKPHLAQTLTQPRPAGSSCPTPPSRGVCPSWTQSTLDIWAGVEQELCASHSVSGTAS